MRKNMRNLEKYAVHTAYFSAYFGNMQIQVAKNYNHDH